LNDSSKHEEYGAINNMNELNMVIKRGCYPRDYLLGLLKIWREVLELLEFSE
jgi:hypothetical protein